MTHLPPSFTADAPIGVFDSGVGGLSVLRHIHARLPREHLIYFADSGYAPYGDRSEDWLVARSLAITAFLVEQGVKALVVACNTATVAAIRAVRMTYPGMPIVGVEPGLKPGAAATRTGKIGVLATDRTLQGEKFLQLRDQVAAASGYEFLLQPCIGLVDRIELGELETEATVALLEGYVVPLLEAGADTLVLGCTHYPFMRGVIERIVAAHAKQPVTLIDTGDAVARQLERLLEGAGLLRPSGTSALDVFTSGDAPALSAAFKALLGLAPAVMAVEIPAI
ncbi:glutamate racemase [Massilia endophytica]|uniref:glutamate racemase n=1 Tax=Massilia endophytica TaxID=2899220 RepID=UPI001E49C61F|nr:glutamate racemase [Massilia endophytica]UGQ47405.1 glutamate racemase [Massilia endophytica]